MGMHEELPEEAQKVPLAFPPAGVNFQYVVLHHTAILQPHFDLMLQLPGCEKLPTWRVGTAPESWMAAAPEAIRIADHRTAYMEYEGAVSGDRGEVKRVSAGVARVLLQGAAAVTVELLTPKHAVLRLPLEIRG